MEERRGGGKGGAGEFYITKCLEIVISSFLCTFFDVGKSFFSLIVSESGGGGHGEQACPIPTQPPRLHH